MQGVAELNTAQWQGQIQPVQHTDLKTIRLANNLPMLLGCKLKTSRHRAFKLQFERHDIFKQARVQPIEMNSHSAQLQLQST